MTRTVLVTGAGSGLGLTISRHLWQLGYQVAMADIAIDIACEGARQIDADRRRLLPLALDIREPEHFHAALAQIDERFGGLDVLVNNAALTLTTPIMEISVEEFDRAPAPTCGAPFSAVRLLAVILVNADRATLSISPRWRDKTAAPPPAPIMQPRKAAF